MKARGGDSRGDESVTVTVTLLTRSGCGLCDEMKLELDAAARGLDIAYREVDVDTDPALVARYGNDVPVLLLDGEKAFEHRASAAAIRERLRERLAPGS